MSDYEINELLEVVKKLRTENNRNFKILNNKFNELLKFAEKNNI